MASGGRHRPRAQGRRLGLAARRGQAGHERGPCGPWRGGHCPLMRGSLAADARVAGCRGSEAVRGHNAESSAAWPPTQRPRGAARSRLPARKEETRRCRSGRWRWASRRTSATSPTSHWTASMVFSASPSSLRMRCPAACLAPVCRLMVCRPM